MLEGLPWTFMMFGRNLLHASLLLCEGLAGENHLQLHTFLTVMGAFECRHEMLQREAGFRMNMEVWLAGFLCKIWSANSLHAELWAVREGVI